MSVHYQHPILLIEFDQDKSFSLQVSSGSQASLGGKGRKGKAVLTRAQQALNDSKGVTLRNSPNELDIQAKLVLLTSAFPRLRIIWSSSPYATADIFADLKMNFEEPDAARVALVGLDEIADASDANQSAAATVTEQSFNLAPQDMLRSLPGVNTKNFRYVMNQVRDISDLCNLSSDEVHDLIGVEPGRQLCQFIKRDVKSIR